MNFSFRRSLEMLFGAFASHARKKAARSRPRFRPQLLALEERVVPAFTVFEGAGIDPAAIAPTRDAFRVAVGGGTGAGANGSFGGLRREINWDGVPAAQSDPNSLPADFFNTTSPRGAVLSTPGTGFLVSANAGGASPTLFGFPNDFQTFSPQKLFTAVNSNITDVNFFLPGTTTPATTSAFGVFFVDVEAAGSTKIEFFDASNTLIFSRDALVGGNQGLSFVGGVANAGEQISRVRLTSGLNTIVADGVLGNQIDDVVVMDDFLYAEPTSVNAAPVNAVPGAQTTAEDTALVFSTGNGNAISVSDPDAGASPVKVTLTAANGLLTLSGVTGLTFTTGDGTADPAMTFTGTIAAIDAALNGLSFAPTLNFNGPASVQIVTDDQGNTGTGGPKSDSDMVSVTVNAVNDAPVNAVPASAQTVAQDTALTFSAANGNALSVADVDAGSGPVKVTLAATHGTATLSTTAGLTVTGNSTPTVQLTGTLAAVNAALNGLTFTPGPGFSGAATLGVTTDDQGNSGTGGPRTDADQVAITVTAKAPTPTPTPAAEPVVIGVNSAGAPGTVQLLDPATGAPIAQIVAYAGFGGEVRVAHGDVNGDGKIDAITGAGGMGGHVKVFDAATGAVLRSFLAFDPAYAGGVFVASGDVDNDGSDDVVVGAGPGAPGGHVEVFSGKDGSLIRSFLAFDRGYVGGVTVASADVNGDGFDDLVVGAALGTSHVEVFSGKDGSLIRSFLAFDSGFLNGVFVGAGDLNGDGKAEVIVGAGAGASPLVKVFSGQDQSLIGNFLAFAPSFLGGTRVGTGRANGKETLLVGSGPSPQPHVVAVDFTGTQVSLSLFVGPALPMSTVFVG